MQPSLSSLGFEESACTKARPRVFFQAQRISKFSVLVLRDKDGYSQFLWFNSSKSATSSLREGSESEEDTTNEAPPPKRPCAVPLSPATSRKYNRKWEKYFPWLESDGNFQGAFCKICRKIETRGQPSQGSGGVCVTKPFQNWKKAVQKMKEHASSEFYLRQVEAELIVSKGETVVHQPQLLDIL